MPDYNPNDNPANVTPAALAAEEAPNRLVEDHDILESLANAFITEDEGPYPVPSHDSLVQAIEEDEIVSIAEEICLSPILSESLQDDIPQFKVKDCYWIVDPEPSYARSLVQKFSHYQAPPNAIRRDATSENRRGQFYSYENYENYLSDINTLFTASPNERIPSENILDISKWSYQTNLRKLIARRDLQSGVPPYGGYNSDLNEYRELSDPYILPEVNELEDYTFTKNENICLVQTSKLYKETPCLRAMRIKKHLIAGETVYSNIPKEVIEYMGECVDLTSLSSLEPSDDSFVKALKAKASPCSRTDKLRIWKNTSYSYGDINDVSLVDAETIIPGTSHTYEALFSTISGNIKPICFSSLYRGRGAVTWERKTKRLSSIFSSTNLILYKVNYNLFNQDTLSWEKATFINALVTISPEKLLKYKRASNFLPKFISKLFLYNGSRIINPEEYARQEELKWGENLTYWSKVKEIFATELLTETANNNCNEDEFSFSTATDIVEDSITDQDTRYLAYYNTLVNNEDVAECKMATESYSSLKLKLDGHKRDLSSQNTAKDRSNEQIAKYESYIKASREDIALQTTKIETLSRAISGLTPGVKSLESTLEVLKTKSEKTLQELLNAPNQQSLSKFIENMDKSGIVIDEVLYVIPTINWLLQYISSQPLNSIRNFNDSIDLTEFEPLINCEGKILIQEEPSIALIARLDKNHELSERLFKIIKDETTMLRGHQEFIPGLEQGFVPKITQIKFHTKKPVIIKVDYAEKGNDCKKMVGGPYCVKVSCSTPSLYGRRNGEQWSSGSQQLSVKLASTDGVFGYDSPSSNGSASRFWIHPHTNSINCGRNEWANFKRSLIENYASACLGDIAPTINKGYQDGDIKTIIYAAMSWLTSANSTDTWGKHYKYFPLLEDVDIEGNGKPDEAQNTELYTEEGMECSLVEIIDTLSNAPTIVLPSSDLEIETADCLLRTFDIPANTLDVLTATAEAILRDSATYSSDLNSLTSVGTTVTAASQETTNPTVIPVEVNVTSETVDTNNNEAVLNNVQEESRGYVSYAEIARQRNMNLNQQ